MPRRRNPRASSETPETLVPRVRVAKLSVTSQLRWLERNHAETNPTIEKRFAPRDSTRHRVHISGKVILVTEIRDFTRLRQAAPRAQESRSSKTTTKRPFDGASISFRPRRRLVRALPSSSISLPPPPPLPASVASLSALRARQVELAN